MVVVVVVVAVVVIVIVLALLALSSEEETQKSNQKHKMLIMQGNSGSISRTTGLWKIVISNVDGMGTPPVFMLIHRNPYPNNASLDALPSGLRGSPGPLVTNKACWPDLRAYARQLARGPKQAKGEGQRKWKEGCCRCCCWRNLCRCCR